MTIGELLNYGFDHLTRAGIPDAVLEAELLLEYVMGRERVYLHLNRNLTVSEAVREKYQSYLADRSRHRPLQHIVGQTEFYGLKFQSDKRALIPRPETEILVEEVLENWQPGFLSILDIGTGSGIIAIALAKHLASAMVTATDYSPEALDLAQENIKLHGLESRVSLVQADLFPEGNEKFDCIVSNPPYIPSGQVAGLQPEVSLCEPVMALDGGADGLEFYRRIAGDVADRLNHPGFVALEVGMGQAEMVSKMMRRALPASEIFIKKDLAGIDRVVLLKMH
ncbi:MAG: protein-(glutamine-N5) methyltransferase, release factor-specific [Candidatus Edwardsbacteria bacterium RifOxyA12_full_54_48]|uniref:Release factor glutamine methyltransferase n=1 Tax=Candidatus Edwardsbacteria bacterium GWF2_54_11 TaxID=1817851 RepID=A0A1F5RIV8_9BACT|nr:MAG: protein-(glutamine-N5) methyltransferase, release factor-specific [Candidatus Edwardsbacteria bacterium RifOxyC12_full_54_24]OGF08714.1 MAG: protein-(glutamine-N5) methyltransferase, release factor-specific [Candidatus Edwardsbacteria bacterium RifOxyA12_full_54_48]OGF12307.1 MAG: protein-(glutamine-N5) methyltransferase, release factor-specific [Candidatus Edwardsbacteria bacterium GWE2_54_12]OGF14348.1 MAG: protein-(glutamine-N5) methyltransferase, release factor-specific [Candidatus E